jgi:hypothetical protein
MFKIKTFLLAESIIKTSVDVDTPHCSQAE